MNFYLEDKDTEFLDNLLSNYETKNAALLPFLTYLQNKYGFITSDIENLTAELLDLPLIKVQEVISFYSLFNKKPIGKYHLQVCQTTGCSINKSQTIFNHIKDILKINCGERTEDKLFSLATVECLAACDKGPVMRVNNTYFYHLTKEKVSTLINQWKSENE